MRYIQRAVAVPHGWLSGPCFNMLRVQTAGPRCREDHVRSSASARIGAGLRGRETPTAPTVADPDRTFALISTRCRRHRSHALVCEGLNQCSQSIGVQKIAQ